jgi:cobalamin biosynthetic protein CobC
MSQLPVLKHGGSGQDFLARHFPEAPRPWIDLSTGINPWPYLHDDISQASWDSLPSPALDRSCRRAAADYFGVAPENLAILPGSQAAISLLPRLYPASSVAVLEPTYGEHHASWQAAGHSVERVGREAIDRTEVMILVITNPNNPNGHTLSRENVLRLIANRPPEKWIIVDEAFVDVVPELGVTDLCASNNLAIFRSFGKFFGLAGVRLGFLVAPIPLAERLEAMIGPWAVAGPALEVGARAYADRSWQETTRHNLKRAMRELHALLRRCRLEILGGTDLFVLVKHPDAQAMVAELCGHGIYVRRFADNASCLRFGLPADASSANRLDHALSRWSQV